jgi:hypothetical protein
MRATRRVRSVRNISFGVKDNKDKNCTLGESGVYNWGYVGCSMQVLSTSLDFFAFSEWRKEDSRLVQQRTAFVLFLLMYSNNCQPPGYIPGTSRLYTALMNCRTIVKHPKKVGFCIASWTVTRLSSMELSLWSSSI